jgi:transposase
MRNKEVAARLDVNPNTVGKWRRRFLEQRIDGLRDAPRSGAPCTIGDEQVEAVITRTRRACLKAATHWKSATAFLYAASVMLLTRRLGR